MGACDVVLIQEACDLAGSAIGAAVEGTFGAVARAIAEAGEAVLREVTTAWTRVPSGSLTNTDAIRLLQGDLRVVTALVAVLGLMAAAAKMAITRRGEDMRDAVAGLVRVMVVGAAGITALTLLLEAGDVFAVWVLDRATEGQFNPALVLTGGTLGAGLMFILGLLAIITGVIQIGLLLVRSSLIVVLAGFWPVAAAGSMTPAGAQTWKKLTGWLLAFILYKPVAAICYAAAFRLLGGGAGAAAAPSLLSTIEGMLLLALAIVALPAMLRLVVPAVSAIGGMSTAGVVAGGAAVATGAVALAGGGVLGGAAAGGASGAGGGIFAGGGSNGSNGGGSAAPGAIGGGPPDSPPGSAGPSGAGRRGSGGPSGSPGEVGSGGTGPGAAAGGGPSAPPGAAGASGGSSDSGGISSGASRTGSGVSATGAVASGSAGVDRGVQNVIEERDDG
jgi:type IV secretion system protein TrbL